MNGFYRYTTGYGWLPIVDGQLLTADDAPFFDGFDLVVHLDAWIGWCVTEQQTGYLVCGGQNSPEDAIRETERRIYYNGTESFQQRILDNIAKQRADGIPPSPRYQGQQNG
jgi:hypothetical protein